MFASIATIAGERSPFENAFSIFFIVPTVGALFGIASNPLCEVWSCRTGAASRRRTPPASAAATTGRRNTGVRIAFQNRFSPLSRRSRCRNGILPLSTLSPSRDSRAGSTVSEPSIATPTTIIVAMPKPRYALSPENIIPPIATITVMPEISTERPDVAAAASSAARGLLPSARSSRSRFK